MMRTLVILLLPAALAGQSLHIHDNARDAQAQAAKAAFEEAGKGDQDVFNTMVSNVRTIEQRTLAELYALNQQTVRAITTQMPLQKWGKLTCDLFDREVQFLRAWQVSQGTLSAAPAGIVVAKEAVASAAKKRADASKALQGAKDALGAGLPAVKNLRTAIDQIRTAISAEAKAPLNLKDLQEFRSLKQAFAGAPGVKDWIEKIETSKGGPGLQLNMLDLSYQLQKAEVEKLQLEVDRLDEEQTYAQKVEDLLTAVLGDGETTLDPRLDPARMRANGGEFLTVYSQFLRFVPPSAASGLCQPYDSEKDPSPPVIQTLGTLARQANAEVGTIPSGTVALENALNGLSINVAVVGYQKYLLMAAMIDHLTNEQIFSIERDALNARTRATLLSHGLDGLSAYYSGGVTSADISNVITAAQTAAAAVIAGKVR